MNDTPRTDTAEWKAVSSSVARKLERELLTAHQMACRAGLERDALREDKARLESEIERWRDSNIRLRAEVEHQAKRAGDLEHDKP